MCNEAQDGTHIDLRNNNNLLVIQFVDIFYNHAAPLILAFRSQNKFHSCIMSYCVHEQTLQPCIYIHNSAKQSKEVCVCVCVCIYTHTHTHTHPLTCPKQDLRNVNKLFFCSILALTLRPRSERHSIRYMYDQYITCSFVLCWC
jgi:hypothetical protein